MARLTKLIKRELLEELYLLHQEGVPGTTLVKRYRLSVTRPTLVKLLGVYHEGKSCLDVNEAHVIMDSLFPDWLEQQPKAVATQDSKHKYIGQFPHGYWTKNDWSTN